MIWLILTAILALQTPTRDAAAPLLAGTGAITGTVVTDDAEARPLRRVQVTLYSGTLVTSLGALTDDAGRFAFGGLAPGNYTLQASRIGYVSAYYGAKKPGRGPGVPIALADGQQVPGATLKMLRGAVIAGAVKLPSGKPAANVDVQAGVVTIANGQRQIAYGERFATDDRGEYRIFGLAPGDYVVQVFGPYLADNARRIGPAEIRAAEALLRSGVATTAAPPAPDPGPSIRYAPVFYPGTADSTRALPIALAAGQERGGVDVALQFVQTARLAGIVIDPDGRPARNAQFTLVRKRTSAGEWDDYLPGPERSGTDGSFYRAGLTPGRYLLMARAAPAVTTPAPAAATGGTPPAPVRYVPPAMTLWALEEFDMNGRDVSGLVLRLQTGMALAGKFVFETGMPTPPDPTRIRLNLMAAASPGAQTPDTFSIFGGSAIAIEKDGTFAIRGAAPGTYRVLVMPPYAGTMTGPAAQTLFVKSIMMNGRDVADLPIEIKPGEDVSGVVVTLSDQLTEISGIVFDQLNRPSAGFPIVVFSTDRAYWPAGDVRVRKVQPASDGKYRITGLPAGEYYVCAVTDLEPADLKDPAFLESLAAAAFKITLAAGEKKAQDLRLGRR